MVEQIDRNIELAQIRQFGACQALKQDFDRSAPLEAGELRFDMGQHAGLRRRFGPPADRIEQPQQPIDVFDRVDGRIDAKNRVAGPQRKAPITQERDSLAVVGGMIRLQSRRESAGHAEKRSRAGRMADLASHEDQLVHVAQLRQRRRHHAGECAADSRDFVAGSLQQAILEFAQRQRGDRCKNVAVDVVTDAHHAVDASLVVRERAFVEMLERQIGEDAAGRFPHVIRRRGKSGLAIARFAVVGCTEECFQPSKTQVAIR